MLVQKQREWVGAASIGYIRHIDRGTDRRNGCEVQHSNPDINPDYTLENESFYKDQNGEWKQTTYSKDMVGAVNRRIDYAREHKARDIFKREK